MPRKKKSTKKHLTFKTSTVSKGIYTALGYGAATFSRGNTPQVVMAHPDWHIRYDREQLLKESQRLYRDNAVYQGIMHRALANIVGTGFQLQARTGSDELNNKIESLWEEWKTNPEVRGVWTFNELESHALKSIWLDGDFGLIKLKGGQVQFIESERIFSFPVTDKTDKGTIIEMGIEKNSQGRPISYHVSDFLPSGLISRQGVRVIKADNFLYLMNPENARPSQSRGIPILTGSLPNVHRLEDILNAEAVAWQLQSRLALIINKSNSDALGNTLSTDDTNKDEDYQIPSRFLELDSGVIFNGEVGEDIRSADRQIPSLNFGESVRFYLRLICLPIGLPIELLLYEFNGNYSNARAMLMEAYRGFNKWQSYLKAKFHSQLFRWKVEQWINEGLLPDKPEAYEHEFITPSFPWIDPIKEAQAIGEKLDRGLCNLAVANAGQGVDYESNMLQRSREFKRAIELAEQLNKEYPNANVDWRFFAGIKVQQQQSKEDTENVDNPEDTNPVQ